MKTPLYNRINLKFILLIGLITIFSCADECDCEKDLDDTILNKCENGFAGIYPCDGYDLIANVSIDKLGGNGASGNDSWGWTDTTTGNEYVLMGTTTGVAFVNISNPIDPIIVGTLPTQTVNSSWRDVKVYNDHAFIVSEAAGHGMQVFDLTKLRDVTEENVIFTTDALYSGFGNAHNIVINESSGFAYAVGTKTFGGGAHFIDIRNPKNPIAAGGISEGGYSHDAQVVTYTGLDLDYVGKEIFIGSNGERNGANEIVIANVTDKSNPTIISKMTYPQQGYTHQGWFTEDFKYFIVGDELDEVDFGGKTRTLVFDLTDLDAPKLHHTYLGETAAIDHNGYIKGNTYYMANYRAGVRMIDISDLENKNMEETGFFDTYPENDNANFNGVWNVYPYFESENIILSNIEGGLFIIRKSIP
jgi:choice-of-anchor B domain-containing protein